MIEDFINHPLTGLFFGYWLAFAAAVCWKKFQPEESILWMALAVICASVSTMHFWSAFSNLLEGSVLVVLRGAS